MTTIRERAGDGEALFSEGFAARMDAEDPLAGHRERFHQPVAPSGEGASVYLCGNSLGLMPRATRAYVEEELEKWATLGVEGHFKTERPWMTIDESVQPQAARLVGAEPEEVTTMGSLSANLHFLLVSFYKPEGARNKLLIEEKCFPSDFHIVTSQIELHGLDPAECLVKVAPREGEHTLRTEDIEAAIAEHGDTLATVLFAGVQYYSGQAFDLARITAAGHAVGAKVGFDLAHAAGNINLQLHDWDVDFAAWCTYKYLNSGPGNIGCAFVHRRFSERTDFPRLRGWWGHRKQDRFQMDHVFEPCPGANAWALSNPCVLATTALRASLDIFDEVGLPALIAKSRLLTGYLEALLQDQLADHVDVITPADEAARGCQLSLVFRQPVKAVHDAIAAQGVICDMREPNVMRISPVPLYNSFTDVFSFVRILKGALESQ